MPNFDILSIFVRALSRFNASVRTFSIAWICDSSRMSIKSITITPPISRNRICRVISFAALRLVLKAVSSGSLSSLNLPLLTSIATSASVCSITIDPRVAKEFFCSLFLQFLSQYHIYEITAYFRCKELKFFRIWA